MLLPTDADVERLMTASNAIASTSDPSVDPTYTGWGTTRASLQYRMLIPYLIASMQNIDGELAGIGARLDALESPSM